MKIRHWEKGENLGDATPVNILGGLWFVGTRPASTHIVKTDEGLVMLDSGYRESLQTVLSHMREAGLFPADIRYIIHTHGHLDHMGATSELVRMTGAKTVLGRLDREAANGTRDLTYSREYDSVWDDPFEPDILVTGGEVLEVGGVKFRCEATPGHTEGCMSWFFDVEHDGKIYRAGLHGGAGTNTMRREYLERYGLPYDLRDRFFESCRRLADERVDIFLGNHMWHNDTPGRTLRKLAGDEFAFVDGEAWGSFLLECKSNLESLIEREKNG